AVPRRRRRRPTRRTPGHHSGARRARDRHPRVDRVGTGLSGLLAVPTPGFGARPGSAYDVVQHWPGTQHLQVAVRMADHRAQSPGESRSRWLFFAEGIPAPELQFEVYDAAGMLVGTTDFAWRRHRLLGEFDGRSKYGRLLRPGQTPEEVVWAEKLREDALRRTTGFGM